MAYKNKQECSELEIKDIVNYLSKTPVRFFAEKNNDFRWFKVEVECPEDLQDLKTWWGELNGLKKNEQNDEEKFGLVEVADMINSNSLPDKELKAKILEYRELLKNNELEVKITLFENGLDVLIADGNKRAVAMLLEGKKVGLNAILITT